ncbi:Berardinelli-Seip congenital lipodystrophy 2 (seipin) [Dissophora ornata]|nr:Berardinelli-Seip congenital lipodystrophy 2 (seipin) [Dissophora ornata]
MPASVPSVIGRGPTAEIDFSRGGLYEQFLRADQAYDISINLHVPTSERNVEIGNFMVVVTLLRADGRTIMTSSRPAILTYQSTPVKLMRTAWKAVPLVLDWSKEVQTLKVPLLENYIEDAENPVARARIEISTPVLQVYKSKLPVRARFAILNLYFMYYYKVSTALVFTSVFIFWEIIFSVVTWQVLSGWFGSDAEALAIAHQIRTQSGAQGVQQSMPGQQQLRAPTTYTSAPTATPRTRLPPVGLSPRQPQLQEKGGYGNDSDSEFEQERDLRTGAKSRAVFDHDEMEDDDDDQDQRQNRDEAVVPERPLTPSQRRYATTGASSSGSRSTITTTQQQRRAFADTDDGASTSGSTTTTTTTTTTGSRRTGRAAREGLDVLTSSSSLHPPPPPPSLLSERSSDFQMSQTGAGVGGSNRRTAVESEYTEEDDEYLEGAEDDEDDGDVTFGEDDFSEAALLSRSPGGVRSARSRHGSEGRNREATRPGMGESTGRSTGRSAGP